MIAVKADNSDDPTYPVGKEQSLLDFTYLAVSTEIVGKWPIIRFSSQILIAEVVDNRGTVKRLNNSVIRFSVEGEGVLLDDGVVGVKPMPVAWGSAPVLVQSTGCAGKIRVMAALEVPGEVRPVEGVLEFNSIPLPIRQFYEKNEIKDKGKQGTTVVQSLSVEALKKSIFAYVKQSTY